MNLTFEPAPWRSVRASAELIEAQQLLRGCWREAAEAFYADFSAAKAHGTRLPKGVQRFINQSLNQRFRAAGWDGTDGRFTKNATWLRLTFRNNMGLGSDFLDGLRVNRLEGMTCCCIAAATAEFLEWISPDDAKGLTSYERLRALANELRGVVDYPLLLGKLGPASKLSPSVERVLLSARPSRAKLKGADS